MSKVCFNNKTSCNKVVAILKYIQIVRDKNYTNQNGMPTNWSNFSISSTTLVAFGARRPTCSYRYNSYNLRRMPLPSHFRNRHFSLGSSIIMR